MPKRMDIKKIMILGSGPIVIGQACEFDYSGTQACIALKKEGYKIILHNSNPATIMTDPEIADVTYIEPLTVEFAEKIIAKEKPDALLPTVGGQTALNLCMNLHESGVLKKYNIELIGANIEAIHKAESRQEFKKVIEKIGLRVPSSYFCNTLIEAKNFLNSHQLPLIIRPSFTLGGTGGGIARSLEEFNEIVQSGLDASPTKEVLIEESVIGWKEFELELMRDIADNVVVICSIENIDAMGVHTGDSITVAPQQTLSDLQYQIMRDAAISIIREVGVETGGSNIQFAVNPKNGDMIVIEMNPRVSRSSALASKATGFPIAKIAALLAIGYTLDELTNEITKVTPCSFEPALDYVVTKIPRFAFEKFPNSDNTLGTMMHSVGECMSIGRTFKESFQKALRSLEISRYGFGVDGDSNTTLEDYLQLKYNKKEYYDNIERNITRPNPNRIFDIKSALEIGVNDTNSKFSVEFIYEKSGIDPWFLYQFLELIEFEKKVEENLFNENNYNLDFLKTAKTLGYSDKQLAFLVNRKKIYNILDELEDNLNIEKTHVYNTSLKDSTPDTNISAKISKISKDNFQKIISATEIEIRNFRYKNNILPVYKRVDTCAAEFESHTPYLYSTYEDEDESSPNNKKKVIIIGGGPNRIGQGIEFDYCCCHASFTLQKLGIESIIINSNPETVSTDYDTSDKLYFEPLTLEDILHICKKEKPFGIILSFGGQTPLKFAGELENAGYNILGTKPKFIDQAEDRDLFSEILKKLNLSQTSSGLAYSTNEAKEIINRISYPVLLRPSYVLGGRAMVIVNHENELEHYMNEALKVSPEHPIFIDSFLEDAQEIDVDALSDGKEVVVAGIMQHIEQAGIHSGDSACILPPQDFNDELIKDITKATELLAIELNIIGLLNIQFAFCKNKLYVIEVNPRASRTIPFVSKTIRLPLASYATRIMCGEKIKDLNIKDNFSKTKIVAVKEVVLPFARFKGTDIILGPEMKSTGEVMGIGENLGQAYIKAQLSTGDKVPKSGGVFFSVHDKAKVKLIEEARTILKLGYKIYSTTGTADFLIKNGIDAIKLEKINSSENFSLRNNNFNPMHLIQNNEINIVINIPLSQKNMDDAYIIRREAIKRRILCVTTIEGTKALVLGLKEISKNLNIISLQEL